MLSKRNQFQEVHDADSTFNTELDGIPQTEPDQVKELADPKGYTSSFSLVLHPLYSALTQSTTRVPAQHMVCRYPLQYNNSCSKEKYTQVSCHKLGRLVLNNSLHPVLCFPIAVASHPHSIFHPAMPLQVHLIFISLGHSLFQKPVCSDIALVACCFHIEFTLAVLLLM